MSVHSRAVAGGVKEKKKMAIDSKLVERRHVGGLVIAKAFTKSCNTDQLK